MSNDADDLCSEIQQIDIDSPPDRILGAKIATGEFLVDDHHE